jgi:ATP-dependent helicase HrpA
MLQPKDIAREPIEPEKADAIHRALLTGLLSNIGVKGHTHEFLGARNSKFNLFPGSALFKRKPQWVMAGEVVETAKVYARTVAPVRPEWIERAGKHLLKRSYVDPHWQSKSAHVVAYEKVTLYGLILVPRRLVHYGPIDPVVSREIFINHALVDFDLKCSADFFRHNRALVEHVELLEAKARRKTFLVDPQVRFAWYNARIPQGIYNGPLFEKWRREAEKENLRLLFMELSDVLKNDASDITTERFPDSLRVGDMELPLGYRFNPGMGEDGVTLTVPLGAVNQLRSASFSWLVRGMLHEKILELIRSLPKPLRVKFVPAPEFAKGAVDTIKPGDGSLEEALAAYLGKVAGERIAPVDFDLDSLPPHLKMNFKVLDLEGRPLAMDRNLARLQRELGAQVQKDLARLPQSEWNRDGITSWDFGDPPQRIDIKRHGMTMAAYPAIVDRGDSVSLKLMESPDSAREATRKGVRRLLAIQLREEMKYLSRSLPDFDELSIYYSTLGSGEKLKQELLAAIVERALFADEGEVRTREQFIARAQDAWKRLSVASQEVVALVAATLKEYHEVAKFLSGPIAPGWREGYADVEQQLEYLLPPDFLARTPFEWLQQLPRFLKAIHIRLKKLMDAGVMRDAAAMAQAKPWWEKYLTRSAEYQARGLKSPDLERYRWMVEELRVSLFAQELKTSIPISPKRLERQLAMLPK